MSDNILILHPRDALYAPADADAVGTALEEAGLVRSRTLTRCDRPSGERRTYRTGPSFEELVHFEKVDRRSRAVLEHASKGPRTIDRSEFIRENCSVVLVGPLSREWFLGNAHTEDPSCGACGAAVDWSSIANTWYETHDEPVRESFPEHVCPACGRRSLPWDFDWRKTAAFTCFYVELWHIHENEATPSKGLLACLERATGTPWSFLYYTL